MFRRIWGSRRARIFTSAGVVAVLLAGTGGGVAIAQSVAHGEALAQARTAAAQATEARQYAADARRVQGLAVAHLTGELDALEQLDVAKLAAVIGADVNDELQDAITAARDALSAAAERTPADVDAVPAVDERMSSSELEAAATAAEEIRDAWKAENAAIGDHILGFQTVRENLDGALTAAAAKAPDAAGAVLAAAPLADEPSKAAVTDAAAALEDADDSAAAFAAFLAAVDAVKAAHAAEEARLAEEAARAAQGTSGRSGSGSRGGSGSTGGGGGVPSTGGGGSPGGGGSTPPVDTRRYADPRGPYTPGCALGGMLYAADPGPGGTAVIGSVTIPYDFRIAGDLVKVYACR